MRTFGRARVNKVCRATYSALRADTAGVWGKQAVLMANGRAQAQFMAMLRRIEALALDAAGPSAAPGDEKQG